MTPQELKNSILQLAIQGKLVEQRSEEGTAEELFKQIQAEKQALIKAGKIKKEKPLPEITEEEKPFDIPESWKWMRLGECSTYSSAKEKISPSDITGDMWSLDLEDIEKKRARLSTIVLQRIEKSLVTRWFSIVDKYYIVNYVRISKKSLLHQRMEFALRN